MWGLYEMKNRVRFLYSLRIIKFIWIIGLFLSCGGDSQENMREMLFSRMAGEAGESRGGMVDAIPVQVELVNKDDISSYILRTTTLEAERTVEIISKASGMITRLRVEEGDFVRQYQILAEIDPREYQLAVQEAQARLNNMKAAYERSLQMRENDLISEEAFENSKYQYESALTQLERSNLNLEYTKVQAPFAGIITSRKVEQGDMINLNENLFTIADFSPILARIYIPEKELRKISVGLTARIKVETVPEVDFTGTVRMISPIVDSESGTVKVTIEVQDKSGILRPGMFASVFVITETHSNVMVIPKMALLLESEEDMVFKYNDGVAKMVPITLGFINGERAEVLNGLEFGDRIITVGQDGLRDGTPVYIAGEQVPIITEQEARKTEVAVQEERNSPPQMNRRGPMGGGNLDDMNPEQVNAIFERMIQNPAVKEEFEKWTKSDPNFENDPEKKKAFLMEMMQSLRPRQREM